MKLTKKLGMLLLGVWLFMTGLMQMVSLPIPILPKLMGILALTSGALLLLGR